ncbi:MAG TPA: hypothetical protein DIT19_04580 [Desulfonauticus sp.]|nr:hypothetical protein [Desulfonauticus sp.]
MEKIYQSLFLLSQEIVQNLNTKYTALHTVLVPVSMALLTEYDANYLGIIRSKDKHLESETEKKITPGVWTLGEQEEK